MAPSALDRLRDRLPVNEPYEGIVAEAYDTWIPVDEAWPDEEVYRRALSDVEDGPVLELGCGTGRPLLRWLAEGMAVEGLDASADMLGILRRHAAERGLDPVLHHGDFAPLSLDGRYGAIVCVAGTFMLIDDAGRAEQALASFLAHLDPGGLVGLSLAVPPHDDLPPLAWRVRRTGTSAEGITYVVHEAMRSDPREQVELVYNRHELYDAAGRLLDTFMRKHRLRWWEREQFEVLLTRLGFVAVHSIGDETAWVTFGQRP